jgi:hypothetical protein
MNVTDNQDFFQLSHNAEMLRQGHGRVNGNQRAREPMTVRSDLRSVGAFPVRASAPVFLSRHLAPGSVHFSEQVCRVSAANATEAGAAIRTIRLGCAGR